MQGEGRAKRVVLGQLQGTSQLCSSPSPESYTSSKTTNVLLHCVSRKSSEVILYSNSLRANPQHEGQVSTEAHVQVVPLCQTRRGCIRIVQSKSKGASLLPLRISLLVLTTWRAAESDAHCSLFMRILQRSIVVLNWRKSLRLKRLIIHLLQHKQRQGFHSCAHAGAPHDCTSATQDTAAAQQQLIAAWHRWHPTHAQR